MLLGIISDTHGLMRPEAIAALRDSDLIIHAGDVGKPDVIDHLRAIAPVFAVRGNIDTQAWATALPETEIVQIAQLRLYLLHDLSHLAIDPAAAGFAAVVFGHSHNPSSETRNGVLYLNPGSAGPRRFRLPLTIGRLRVTGKKIEPEIVELTVR
jgi:putative phosphoesterase